jgi:predicted nucleic acid-binding protein
VSSDSGSPGSAPPTLVVDASVVIKWHVDEIHADAARRLLADDAPAMHVPELMFPEVGNILWKKTRRGELTEAHARRIAHLITRAPLDVHPSAPLLEAALEIATNTGRTVYDSMYLAVAVRLQCRLMTADEKLYNALKDGPLGGHILWVGDDFSMATADRMVDFEISCLNEIPSAEDIELMNSYFTGDRLTDADLMQLTGLLDIRELYLQSRGVTDAGLSRLGELRRLTTLYLSGTSITDMGLVYVGALRGLRTLNLAKTGITDAGLPHLSGLTNLHKLTLWGTDVTDLGLTYLRCLTGLRELDLENTQVSVAGVEELRRALPEAEIFSSVKQKVHTSRPGQ